MPPKAKLTVSVAALLLAATAYAAPPRTDGNWIPDFVRGTTGPFPDQPFVADMSPSGEVAVCGHVADSGQTILRVARWTGHSWKILARGLRRPASPPTPTAIDVDTLGNVTIAGNFTEAVGDDGSVVPVPGLARWDELAGAWEAVGEGAQGVVVALESDAGGSVFVGGDFSTVKNPGGASVAAENVAAWNPTARTWAAVGGGTDGLVLVLEVGPSGSLCVGGPFVDVFDAGGAPLTANGIALWDGTSWSAFGQGLSQGEVNHLEYDASGNLFAGGVLFVATNTDGSQAPGPVAVWDGSRWTSLSYVFQLDDLAVDGAGFVYVMSQFLFSARVDRYAPASGWVKIAEPIAEPLTVLEAHRDVPGQGNVYLGGLYFGISEPLTGTHAAVFNHSLWNGHWAPMIGSGANGVVRALAEQPGPFTRWLVAGGDFQEIAGIIANGVARFDGVRWSELGQGVSGVVHALASAGTTAFVYVGGDFECVADAAGPPIDVDHVARWSEASGWERLGRGVSGPVFALKLMPGVAVGDEGVLVVGGSFDTAFNADGSPVAVKDVAVFDLEADSWVSVGGVDGPGAVVNAIAARGVYDFEDFYVGGLFESAVDPGGASRPASNVARWKLNASQWSALAGGVDDEVLDLEFQPLVGNARLFVAGRFTSATDGGGSRQFRRVGFWHEDSQAWVPLGLGADGPVHDVALSPLGTNEWMAAGEFTTVFDASGAAVPAARVARFDLLGGVWDTYGSGTDAAIYALHVLPTCSGLGEVVYAGGDFLAAGGRLARHLAKWRWEDFPVVAVLRGSGGGCGPTQSCMVGVVALTCWEIQRAAGSVTPVVGGLDFREAVAVTSFPRGEPFPVYLTEDGNPANVVAAFPEVTLEAEKDYAIVFVGLDDPGSYAPNPDGLDTSLSLVALELPPPGSGLRAGQDVAVVLVHAVTDAPAVDVAAVGGGTLAVGVAYGSAAPAASLPAGAHDLEVRRSSDGALLGVYPVDLTGLEGRAVTVMLSGFLDPAANGGGPAVAANGYAEGIDVTLDTDLDGVRDFEDECRTSNTSPGVDVAGCAPGIVNALLPGGCFMNDAIAACPADASSPYAAARCVRQLAATWQGEGRIDAAQRTALVACANRDVVRTEEAPEQAAVALEFGLRAVTPNPARGVVAVEFAVPRDEEATLDVYDVGGRRVRQLRGGVAAAGTHRAAWDLRDPAGQRVGAGIYFVRLTAGGHVGTRKVVVLE